jgi:AraC-like DNA-binding protein
VLAGSVREQFAAATHYQFNAVHANSFGEALELSKRPDLMALILSISAMCPVDCSRVDDLLRLSPGVPRIAVVIDTDAGDSGNLSRLGAMGVRRVIDLRGREGWGALRRLLSTEPRFSEAEIRGVVHEAIGECSQSTRHFFDTLFRVASYTSKANGLAAHLDTHPSTLASRFYRRGLPSPKDYLSATRILFASSLFADREMSVTGVANQLRYSSPQTFQRHIRARFGQSVGAFRYTYSFRRTKDLYLSELIVPYAAQFRTFEPLDNRGECDQSVLHQ